MQVKDLAGSATRFGKRAGAAVGDYVAGAKAAGNKWKAAVDNAEDNWAAGTQAAIARGAFKKGVSKAGADYYTARVDKLGQARYAQGVQEGAGNWSEGFKPYADALNNLNLPAGGPKGDARNQGRSTAVQIELRRVKELNA